MEGEGRTRMRTRRTMRARTGAGDDLVDVEAVVGAGEVPRQRVGEGGVAGEGIAAVG